MYSSAWRALIGIRRRFHLGTRLEESTAEGAAQYADTHHQRRTAKKHRDHRAGQRTRKRKGKRDGQYPPGSLRIAKPPRKAGI
ncbi:MAG: hypothetical protein DCC68_15065 [Planctomycetota bacterium]|nr:MAG: hypothetical protein DCC68_15065 [Planctomycetota bacterium]